MSDHKTEQPTPRRREKARQEGQVARSRELSSALAVLSAILFVAWRASSDLAGWRSLIRASLQSTSANADMTVLLQTLCIAALYWITPLVLLAWSVALMSSLAQGGITWAPATLAIRPDRLNPASHLKQIFSTAAVSSMLRSLVPASAILYLVFGILGREWAAFAWFGFRGRAELITRLLSLLFETAWKSSLVMLLWSIADYLFVRYRVEGGLKMTREELRREHRESEGDPQVKARVRRMQRQARRRQMLKDVARAAVVVTNPTHYAIALAYGPELAAPVLLAKGRDRLAQEIKSVARWNNVPMVENPPLAHALYRAVSVGDSIPSRLYVAVAEVLAFVYRVQSAAGTHRRPQ